MQPGLSARPWGSPQRRAQVLSVGLFPGMGMEGVHLRGRNVPLGLIFFLFGKNKSGGHRQLKQGVLGITGGRVRTPPPACGGSAGGGSPLMDRAMGWGPREGSEPGHKHGMGSDIHPTRRTAEAPPIPLGAPGTRRLTPTSSVSHVHPQGPCSDPEALPAWAGVGVGTGPLCLCLWDTAPPAPSRASFPFSVWELHPPVSVNV